MNDPHELDGALRRLPAHDLPPERREALRRRARAELRRGASWSERIERIYARTVEPALVFGVAPLYLAWGVQQTWIVLTGG
jgi:hypothetical protein